MDPITIGLVVAGLGLSIFGQSAAKDAQKKQLALQQQQNEERKQAAQLDALRRNREIIRQGVAAHAFAKATATSEGANFGSGLAGAYGGISGRSGVNASGVNQNLGFASNIFALQGGINAAQIAQANAQGISSIGSGLSSLGGALAQNYAQINRLGNYFFGSPTTPVSAAQGGSNAYGAATSGSYSGGGYNDMTFTGGSGAWSTATGQ